MMDKDPRETYLNEGVHAVSNGDTRLLHKLKPETQSPETKY